MHTWKIAIALIGLLMLGLAGLAMAHSGRTDSSGCHHDRRNGGYHCHGGSGGGGGYSGGYSSGGRSPRLAPTRLQVVAIPRARVWVDDVYIGMSPTKVVKVADAEVEIRLEHAALGSHETTITIDNGETTELTLRW